MANKARQALLAYIASADIRDNAGSLHAYRAVNHIQAPTGAQVDAQRLYGAGADPPRAGLYRTVHMPTSGLAPAHAGTVKGLRKCAMGHLLQANNLCGHGHA